MANRRSRHISTLGSRLTSLVSVCLVLILLGIAALIGVAGSQLQRDVVENMGFVVVMERDCPASATDAVKRALLVRSDIDRFAYTSADDILASESEILGNDIAASLDANPYAAEFDVRVAAPYAYPDSIDKIAGVFGSIPGVAEVVYDTDIAAGLHSTLRRTGIVLGALALALSVISVCLINNAVSLSVYGRRFIIHTMKLVGATPAHIRRPFVLAGLEGGLAAGFVAGGLILLVRYYAPVIDASLASLLPWRLVAAIAVSLVVIGGILCAATAYLAAEKYLKSSYDEMFMK